jgi:hypothetical protein
MPSMDYLLGEICVDGPEHREEAVKFNADSGRELEWPEGWWAVSDDQFAYLAFFQFEADAWAYRLYLVNARMNGTGKRYVKADVKIDADEGRVKEPANWRKWKKTRQPLVPRHRREAKRKAKR